MSEQKQADVEASDFMSDFCKKMRYGSLTERDVGFVDLRESGGIDTCVRLVLGFEEDGDERDWYLRYHFFRRTGGMGKRQNTYTEYCHDQDEVRERTHKFHRPKMIMEKMSRDYFQSDAKVSARTTSNGRLVRWNEDKRRAARAEALAEARA